jgi:hypothetical protein
MESSEFDAALSLAKETFPWQAEHTLFFLMQNEMEDL